MRVSVLLLVLVLLPVAAAGQVTLTLDADEYVQGDVVVVTVHNGTTEPVAFVSMPWFCVDRVDGEYPGCVGLPVITELAPGETWVGEHDTATLPDPAGEYVVGPAAAGVEAAYYTLHEGVASESQRWSSLKSLYGRGDDGVE